MKSIFVTSVYLILLGFIVVPAISQDGVVSGSHSASKAWDSLVQAKGSRTKIHAVRSMLINYSGITELHVFPNYQWRFGHHLFNGPAFLDVTDAVLGIETVADEKGPTDVDRRDDFGTKWLQLAVVPYLLETKWYKPTPKNVRRESSGKMKLDVIETVVGGERMDFVYEPEEMMVREVRRYNKKGVLWEKIRFADYGSVNEVMMPRKFAVGISANKFDELTELTPLSFAFNVDYDPKIFEAPFKATTSDAWKRKP